MLTGPPDSVIERLGLRPGRLVVLKNVPRQNASWLVEAPGEKRLVLRRYHPGATPSDLAYEHTVLRYLGGAGWILPEPLGPLIHDAGLWYCLTRYVPGDAIARETTWQRRRRGRDLACLHVALRGLSARIGQRPGWQPQHTGVTAHTGIDWQSCLHGLTQVSPRLGSWASAAAAETRKTLAAIGADSLPLTVVHGDFAEWNVHYQHGRLAGVIDFGLTHLDTRPYELAIARTHRSPETIDAYRAELVRNGWPLSDLEEAAIVPVRHAFRVDMAAWQIDHGLRTGRYDLAMIERQLAKTGTPPP